jgi:hypothetical protein
MIKGAFHVVPVSNITVAMPRFVRSRTRPMRWPCGSGWWTTCSP